MTTDEGDLTYLELVEYLRSDEARKYAGKWVGVLENWGLSLDERRKIVVSGTSPEVVRDQMRGDYKKELADRHNFSVVKIPEAGGELEVAILWAGLEETEWEWRLSD